MAHTLPLSHAHPPSLQATLKVARLNEILGKLEGACLKHTDKATLDACGVAWRSVLEQEGAPTLSEAARVRLLRLCGKLQVSLKPLSAPIVKHIVKETPPDLGDLSVALLR